MSDDSTSHRTDHPRLGAGQGLIVTIDVEDHTPPTSAPRLDGAIAPVLDLLHERRARATFFVVGELIESRRDLLLQLLADGHELGLHGFTHRYLQDLGPKGLTEELKRGVDSFHQHLSQQPAGFRAPYSSLTRDTPWAPDILIEAGFQYSSSVLPAPNPIAGFSGAPRRPFRWPCGLLELPTPVFGRGRLSIPALGGAYLRLTPEPVFRLALRTHSLEVGDWTYAHPYDFDTTEPFFRRPGQSWLEAKLLFARRRLMLKRFGRLVVSGSPTLGECAERLGRSADLPVFPSESIPT